MEQSANKNRQMLYHEFEFVANTGYTSTSPSSLFCFVQSSSSIQLIPEFLRLNATVLFVLYMRLLFHWCKLNFSVRLFFSCSVKLFSSVTVTPLLFPLTYHAQKMLPIASKWNKLLEITKYKLLLSFVSSFVFYIYNKISSLQVLNELELK